MRRTLYTLISIIWSLWFGGLILLFMAVQLLFTTFADRHDLAGQAAQQIFHLFDKYQLALAGLALVLTFIWRVVSPKSGKTVFFTGFALATLAAVVIATVLSPKIVLLAGQGLQQTAQFKKMHGLSMAVYLAETIVLLITGLLLHFKRDREAI
jgi:uncharacterized protein DUF4149